MFSQDRSTELAVVICNAAPARRHACFRALVAVLFAAGLALIAAETAAAPVTFQFEATVSDVLGSNEVANLLPFEPMVGQHIAGEVIFTPVPFGQTSANDAALEVDWQGQVFSALSEKLTTVDNYFVSPGFPFDGLSIECGLLLGCASGPPTISVIELSLVLRSFDDVIPTGQLIDSAYSWNQFDERSLVLRIADVMDRRMTVIGTVGPVRAIPESASVVLAAIAFPWVLLSRGVLRWRGYRRTSGH